MDRFEEKRKKFKFPLFDDEEPVKLPEKNPRHLFQQQDSLDVTIDETFSKSVDINSVDKPNQIDSTLDATQDKLLNETTENFDFSYQGPPMEKPIIEMRKPIFYNDHHSSFEEKKRVGKSQRKPNFKAPIIEEKLVRKASKVPSYVEDACPRPSSSHHFVPRKIPSQITKHTLENDEKKLDANEILKRLNKTNASYLSFDLDGGQVYRESDELKIERDLKQGFLSDIPGIFDEDTLVSDSSAAEEFEEIPLTRQEFKKLSKKGDVDLPAITKKKQKEMKTPRLDKGLGSIIEEQMLTHKNSQYFDN